MKLIVGLGNPGREYVATRHNIGFEVLEAFAVRLGWIPNAGDFDRQARSNFDGLALDGTILPHTGGVTGKLLLLKPMTYMNLSGQSVSAALGFYKVEPSALIVFHDEIDILLGRVRVKTGGGHGGHNGIRDIMAHLGPDFRRVRLGVGHPGEKELVHNHVLQEFAKQERELAGKVIEAVAAEVPRLVTDDEGGFMSRVAFLLAPPKPKKEKPPEKPDGREEKPKPPPNQEE